MKLATALRSLSILSAVAALGAGCVTGGDADTDALLDMDTGDSLATKGVTLNGIAMNGVTLNGIALNGVTLNGVAFNGVTLNGNRLDGLAMRGFLPQGWTASGSPVSLEIRGGELVALLGDGHELHGASLAGMTIWALLSNGDTVRMRLDSAAPTADPEIHHYGVSYYNGSGWASICAGADNQPLPALALTGRWDLSSGTPTGGAHIDDPELFTFACTNASLAKCVNAGYVPWRSATECDGNACRTVPLRAMHQACVRMLRADYCGDGTPHTQNGTPVNVWDDLDIQVRDDGLSGVWWKEAEWGQGGAVCMMNVRWTGEANDYVEAHCPERWATKSSPCFTPESTFFTENGMSTPIGERGLIRNEFTHDPL